jgi:hypothetical protein
LLRRFARARYFGLTRLLESTPDITNYGMPTHFGCPGI